MSRAFLFFVGVHQPSDAKRFRMVCVSVNRLETRKKPLGPARVFVDSGAFTKVNKHGGYPEPPEAYAQKLFRLHRSGVARILVAVAEDYMCEGFVLAKTGLSVEDHQRLTVERYDALLAELNRLFDGRVPFHVMPVLQGQTPADYLRHIAMYGDRLKPRMWVGVGSVCKRQGKVAVIEGLLRAIKEVRPDLRLHGFRREADRPVQRRRPAAALERRLHGLELQRPQAGPQRQRLAGGQGLRRAGAPAAPGAGAARPVRPRRVRAA